jgi:Rieske 2Fe-2S family protein
MMVDFTAISRLLDERKPGHSLAQALYNSQNAFDFDMRAIFGRSWLMVGFEVELPRPGSWMATSVGQWPVIVTRDRHGDLHAFHNTCRHRGAQICKPGKGSAHRLVCPYHRWTYEMSGELVQATRMPENFERGDHGLAPIHVESLGGVLYICLADDPPDISPFKAALEPMLAPHNLKDSKLAFESTLVERGNWKLVMENARECYHCAISHPELARSFPTGAAAHFDFGEDRRQEDFVARLARAGLDVGPVEGDWWQAMRFTLNEGFKSMSMSGDFGVKKLMCDIDGGDIGSLRWASEPHAFAHATADQVLMFQAMPLGPNESVVTAKWLVHKDAVEGVDYQLEDLTDLWTRTNVQDRDLVENNQAGVNSPGYTPGPYSPDAEALAIRFVDWYCAVARDYLNGQGVGSVAPDRSLRSVG